MRDDLINPDVQETRRISLKVQFNKLNNQKILVSLMRCVYNSMQMTHNKEHPIQSPIGHLFHLDHANPKNMCHKPHNNKSNNTESYLSNLRDSI
jgi:hypothetical protein